MTCTVSFAESMFQSLCGIFLRMVTAIGRGQTECRGESRDITQQKAIGTRASVQADPWGPRSIGLARVRPRIDLPEAWPICNELIARLMIGETPAIKSASSACGSGEAARRGCARRFSRSHLGCGAGTDASLKHPCASLCARKLGVATTGPAPAVVVTEGGTPSLRSRPARARGCVQSHGRLVRLSRARAADLLQPSTRVSRQDST